MHFIRLKNKKRSLPIIEGQKGAATVELAFAMMALLLFFAIYMVFVQIFIAQERSIFAGFTGARTYAVTADRGTGPAIYAAKSIARDASVHITGNHVQIKKAVPIPSGLNRFLNRGQGRFTFTYRSPTKKEPNFTTDDNRFPY